MNPASILMSLSSSFAFFFFNDTATTEIYTLSLHDALPICSLHKEAHSNPHIDRVLGSKCANNTVNKVLEKNIFTLFIKDRKSTRLNSSHANISYAVFCLKKKKIS